VNNEREPGGALGRLFRGVRSALIGIEADRAPVADNPARSAIQAPASAAAADELIKEGLRQRQEHGVAAALPFFERAAQLEPNSHVPFFMLGNVASELGNLDAAVLHYERARELQPNDHAIRYNLGLNQLWRGYIDVAIANLRAAYSLIPAYHPAQSNYIMALHDSDRVSPGEIAATTREWGARFALLHPAAARSQQLRASMRPRFEQSSLREERRIAAKSEELLRSAWQQYLAHPE
jgi:tetratricopeptide (TPR) repeat protein